MIAGRDNPIRTWHLVGILEGLSWHTDDFGSWMHSVKLGKDLVGDLATAGAEKAGEA